MHCWLCVHNAGSDSATEPDSKSSSGESSSGVTSASEASSSSDEEERAADLAQQHAVDGFYVINAFTMCYHAAVAVGDGKYGRACAQSRDTCGSRWKISKERPLIGDGAFFACSHSACSSALKD